MDSRDAPPKPPRSRARRRAARLAAWWATLAAASGIVVAFTLAAVLLSGKDPGGPAPEREPRASGGCQRPYADSSRWNTPIGEDPGVADPSFELEHDPGATLSSDPTQYTYPVYTVDAGTPRADVELRGLFSHVRGDETLAIQKGGTVRLPLPEGVTAAAGSDAQLIVVDWETGEEWGVWKAERGGDGTWSIENGYRYNVRWDGVPPANPQGRPFISRGAGVPYFTGLVRPCEIERGRIDHALAFAYNYPSPEHVYPATKSDGLGQAADALPEGTRLQLDPSLTARDLAAMECTAPCLTIARALQRYGMFVVDNAGRPKVMMEYEDTAQWNGRVTDKTVSPLPLTSFRVLESPAVRDARAGG